MTVNFSFPRDKAKLFPRTLYMSEGTRGAITGQFERALEATARKIGTPVSCLRTARLKLAGEIWGRKVISFNQLSDAELWAMHQWIVTVQGRRNAYETFKAWLEEGYGKQLTLPE